ncbi:MAG: hypothetical protein ACPH3A_10195, partial [Luminiphilus sp.]
MLSYCTEWLRRPMGKLKDYVVGGWGIEDWVEAAMNDRDVIDPPNGLTSYTPEDLMTKGFGSVRSDAPQLQKGDVWFARWFSGHDHLGP